MNHSQTETDTVREMRNLTTACQKHAKDGSEHLKVCQKLSASMCSSAEIADQAAGRAEEAKKRAARSAELAEGSEKRAYHAKRCAVDAEMRAECSVHEAKAAAIVATEAAQRALKTKRAIKLSLLGAILTYAAIHFFTHKTP